MAELRYNPLLDTWVMHAPNRQDRPHLPKDWCPFCPSAGLVPADFEVLAYPNDYPVLSQSPDPIHRIESNVYMNEKAYGACEVLLYSKEHNQHLSTLTHQHIIKLIQLWQARNIEWSKDEKIKYVHIFENKGEEVGVTIHHPHGQLYAHSWIPTKIETELINSKIYFEEQNAVLFDDMIAEEIQYQKRVIAENDSFVAFIPYFIDYPYGVYICNKKKYSHINELNDTDNALLASILQQVTKAFDALFNKPFPYMMSLHQCPVNAIEFDDARDYYRFHIQFYTPLREASKIKWYAGSEMGAGAAANPLDVDQCAASLRNSLVKV